MNRAETKRHLEAAIADGRPAPVCPVELPLDDVLEFPKVFQPRAQGSAFSRSHVRELAKVVNRGQPLDPIRVYWVGIGWAVIDGHHRLQAYRQAGGQKPIRVTSWVGTLDDAIAYSGKANSGEKLMMTNPEKAAYAWQLTVLTKLSKSQASTASGVAEGTIANMRRALVKLTAMGRTEDDLAEMSWGRARMEAEGESTSKDVDYDDLDAKKAQVMAERIMKAIGKHGLSKPHILAAALEICDTRLPDALGAEWGHRTGLAVDLPEDSDDEDF